MDKELIKKSFRRCIPTYNDHAFAQKMICEKLMGFITNQGMRFNKVFEIGSGTGLFTGLLIENHQVEEYVVNDLVEEIEPIIAKVMEKGGCRNWSFLPGDAENINIPRNLDLVVSGSTIQWLTNHNLFFSKIAESMNNGGWLVFNTFGKQNYIENSTLTGEGLLYPERKQMEKILEKNFEVLISQEEIIKLKFTDPHEVLGHFRKTGVNGLNYSGWTKSKLQDYIIRYQDIFQFQDGVALTYHPLYFVVRKK